MLVSFDLHGVFCCLSPHWWRVLIDPFPTAGPNSSTKAASVDNFRSKAFSWKKGFMQPHCITAGHGQFRELALIRQFWPCSGQISVGIVQEAPNYSEGSSWCEPVCKAFCCSFLLSFAVSAATAAFTNLVLLLFFCLFLSLKVLFLLNGTLFTQQPISLVKKRLKKRPWF